MVKLSDWSNQWFGAGYEFANRFDPSGSICHLLAMPVRLCIALFLLHGFIFSAGAQEKSKSHARVALVIGNAKYEAAVGPLRNPVNDAKSIAKTLRGLGFSVVEEHNVTRDELLESVAAFRKRLSGIEVALFYYAGHGISVAGSNYLIPVKSGYNPEGVDELGLRLLAETRLFNAEQVIAEMNAAGGLCNLVILDACRSTPLARNPRSRDVTKPGGLLEMKPPAGSLIAFATDAGHTAQDGSGANGLYTEALLKHLRTPDLTIEQVFKRTRAEVMERSDGGQIPAEYSRLIGEDIFLAGRAEPTGIQSGVPSVEAAPRSLKAEPVAIPTAAAINKLAAAGKTAECIEALKLATADRGPGDFAATPLDSLLEVAKEDLKETNLSAQKIEAVMEICDGVLQAIRDCLPPEHLQKAALTAKAQNRRGDCLLRLGRAGDALAAYDIAVGMAPEDAYPIYNRGRARLVLGRKDEAKADFTHASKPEFNQPKARKLSLAALKELE